MGTMKIDLLYLVITAIVALGVTAAIVFLMQLMQPGFSVATLGNAVFIYIGVFAAILIMEVIHQRLERRGRR